LIAPLPRPTLRLHLLALPDAADAFPEEWNDGNKGHCPLNKHTHITANHAIIAE